MTASAKSVRGSVKSIDYLREEGKGYELERNRIFGESSKEIMQSFRIQQSINTNCQKKFITAYISPHPNDGKKLSDEELKQISRDFMRNIGVNPDKQAFLSVVHTEKEHKHVHLYINRIDSSGKAIKDNYLVLKAQNAAHKIAKEKGLISSRDIMNKRLNKEAEKSKELKSKIYQAHKEVMSIKPQTLSKYMQYMKAMGYEVKPVTNKQQEIQGFRIKDKKSEQDFKMSDIKREMSINQISKELKYDLEYKLNKSLSKSLQKESLLQKNQEKSKGIEI